MKILLVSDADIATDLYSLAIESYFENTQVLLAESEQEAISHIKNNLNLSCIISNLKLQNGSNCVGIFQYAQANSKASFFLIANDELKNISEFKQHATSHILQSPIEIKSLIAAIASDCPEAKSLETEKFCKVATKTLLLSPNKFDVALYIKLSSSKYIKAINVGEKFTAEDYMKYSAKKIDCLYLQKKDFLILVEHWLEDLQKLTDDVNGELSIEKAANVLTSIHASVHAAISSEGFTPELKKLTEKSVLLAVKTIKNNPALSTLLDKLKPENAPYISAHSTALAFISCHLASIMEWNSETTYYKLSLAAYLHDITIENDDWAKLQTKEEIASSGLSQKEKRLILMHPAEASALLSQMEEIPGEVAFIIEQHHELPDGDGFPFAISHKEISPVSALFIIAHDMVSEMQKNPATFVFSDFLQERENTRAYTRGSLGVVFRTICAKTNKNT